MRCASKNLIIVRQSMRTKLLAICFSSTLRRRLLTRTNMAISGCFFFFENWLQCEKRGFLHVFVCFCDCFLSSSRTYYFFFLFLYNLRLLVSKTLRGNTLVVSDISDYTRKSFIPAQNLGDKSGNVTIDVYGT